MAVTVDTIAATGNAYIDGVSSTAAWTETTPETPLVVTYSYPTAASNYPATYSLSEEPDSGFAVFNGTQQAFIDNELLRLSTYYIPVTFTEITETDSVHAIIRFANSSVPDPAHAYVPSSPIVSSGGDVWIDPNQFSLGSPAVGNYAGFTHQHETLHSIGLKHSHEVGTVVPSDMDFVEFTIMSYRSYEGKAVGAFTIAANNYPTTPMLLDIQILHRMYGSVAPHSSDIEYHISPTTGALSRNGVVQFTPPANIVFMTYPPERTSGVIALDHSDRTTNMAISLIPGEGSILDDNQLAFLGDTTHFAAANVYVPIMYGGETDAMPTRVKVGSGNNTVVGNSKTNTIVLTGARADYTAVDHGDGTYTITKTADSKTNVIYAIEFVEFSDETVAVGDLDETPPGPGHTNIAFTVTA